MSGWPGCLEGQDVLARVKENSPTGEVVAELEADTTEPNGLRWSLFGKDAEWFYLDEKHIRLNSSAEKILDREVLADDMPGSGRFRAVLKPENEK